jgi:F0F1-type ATP synthase assembly protein I
MIHIPAVAVVLLILAAFVTGVVVGIFLSVFADRLFHGDSE